MPYGWIGGEKVEDFFSFFLWGVRGDTYVCTNEAMGLEKRREMEDNKKFWNLTLTKVSGRKSRHEVVSRPIDILLISASETGFWRVLVSARGLSCKKSKREAFPMDLPAPPRPFTLPTHFPSNLLFPRYIDISFFFLFLYIFYKFWPTGWSSEFISCVDQAV